MVPQPTLLERRRRDMINAIESSAVALALEVGHSNVTVAMICERAGISRSTFFNHVPSREAAIFGRPFDMIGGEAFERIMSVSAADPGLGVFRALLASAGGVEVNPEVARGRRELAAAQPDAAGALVGVFSTVIAQAAVELVGWLAADPSRRRMPEVSLLREATLTVGVASSAIHVFIVESSGESDVHLTEDDYRRAAAEIERIARAGAEPREPGR